MNKKFLILICLILFFVSIAGVAAAEDLNQTIDDDLVDTLSVSLIDDEIGAKDAGTFTALQEKINNAQAGSTITLENDYKYDSGFSTDGITINKKLTINGNGYTIDGNKKASIFQVNSGVSVTLNFINFINGYSENSGGAIIDYGDLSINNCNFNNNFASSNGGAIYVTGNKLNIADSSFNNNRANDDRGGAIYNSYGGGDFIIRGCHFIGNMADNYGDGGAIFSSSGNLIVSDSSFKSNVASDSGAAICARENCKIYNSEFLSNSADLGAVYGETINVVSSSFKDNTRYLEHYGDSVNGKTLNITNCEFSSNKDSHFVTASWNPSLYVLNNKMNGKGDFDILFDGDISYIKSPTYIVFNNLTVDYGQNAVITCNIYDSDNNNIKLGDTFGCDIRNKYTLDDIFIDLNFEGGSYKCSVDDLDKGIYIVDTDTDFKVKRGNLKVEPFDETLYKLVYDAKPGDTINLDKDYNCSKLYIDKKLTINGNGHTLNGDYNSYILFIDCHCSDVVINDVTFTNGVRDLDLDAIYDGGAICSRGDNVLIKNSRFVKNNGYFAGAIDIKGNNTVVQDCTFSDNYVSIKQGMKISLITDGGNVVYSYENSSGAIVWEGDNGILANSQFTNNKGYYTDVYWLGKNGTMINNPFKLNVPDVTKNYGGSERLVATLTENNKPISGAKININLNGVDYPKTTDSKGQASIAINLPAGDYDATVTYGDISTTAKVKVNKLATKTSLSSSKNSHNSVTLTATINPSTATGNVVFNVNGKNYPATKVSGAKATYTLNDLAVGSYEAKATYNGDSNHKASTSASVKFTVEDVKIFVSAPDLTKYYKGSEKFVVTVKENNKAVVGKDVTITLNGKPYTRTTDDKGQASMAINLNSGVYTVSSEFEGIKVNSKITVKSTVSGKDVTKIFKNGTQYYATFVDTKGNLMKNTDVKFNINGVFYTRTTDDKGVAKMNINLPPKDEGYIITAENPDSTEKYTNVIKVLPSIVENHDLTKYYRNESKYTLRIIGDDGNPVGEGVTVRLNINGVFYTRATNASGYMAMNINLPPGTYTVTAEYNGLRASNTITVKSIFEAKDLTKQFGDITPFTVKLLDGHGLPNAHKTITFNINGVFYTRTTDLLGIARLNINLLPGQYIITSMYDELSASTSNTVTIASLLG